MKLLPRFLRGLIPWSHQIIWWNFSHDCWWERSKFHIGDVLKERGSCGFLPPQPWLRALDLTRLSRSQKHLDFNQSSSWFSCTLKFENHCIAPCFIFLFFSSQAQGLTLDKLEHHFLLSMYVFIIAPILALTLLSQHDLLFPHLIQ